MSIEEKLSTCTASSNSGSMLCCAMFLHESKTLCRRLILIGTKSGSSGNKKSSRASMYLSNILFTLLLFIVLHKQNKIPSLLPS